MDKTKKEYKLENVCVCMCVSRPNNGISEIQEQFNIRKPVNIIHHMNRLNQEIYMIILINTIKASDKTEHLFLILIKIYLLLEQEDIALTK